jgi:hypothetical protein
VGVGKLQQFTGTKMAEIQFKIVRKDSVHAKPSGLMCTICSRQQAMERLIIYRKTRDQLTSSFLGVKTPRSRIRNLRLNEQLRFPDQQDCPWSSCQRVGILARI